MEFSRPEYWSGQPFPSPGELPNPGIEPRPPAWQARILPLIHPCTGPGVPKLSWIPSLTPHLSPAPDPLSWGPGPGACCPWLSSFLFLAQQDPSFLVNCSADVQIPQNCGHSSIWTLKNEKQFFFSSKRKQLYQESGRKFSSGNWLVIILTGDPSSFSSQASEMKKLSQAVSSWDLKVISDCVGKSSSIYLCSIHSPPPQTDMRQISTSLVEFLTCGIIFQPPANQWLPRPPSQILASVPTWYLLSTLCPEESTKSSSSTTPTHFSRHPCFYSDPSSVGHSGSKTFQFSLAPPGHWLGCFRPQVTATPKNSSSWKNKCF